MDNSTITYVQSKNQLDVYNKILKKAIREAKTIMNLIKIRIIFDVFGEP